MLSERVNRNQIRAKANGGQSGIITGAHPLQLIPSKCRRVRATNFRNFGASQRVLVVFIIIMQEIVDLTEVETQTDADSFDGNKLFGRRVNRWNDGPEQFVTSGERNAPGRPGSELKISPTRLKFSANMNRQQIVRNPPRQAIQLKQNRSRSLPSERRRLTMAPAYEIWPDVGDRRPMMAATNFQTLEHSAPLESIAPKSQAQGRANHGPKYKNFSYGQTPNSWESKFQRQPNAAPSELIGRQVVSPHPLLVKLRAVPRPRNSNQRARRKSDPENMMQESEGGETMTHEEEDSPEIQEAGDEAIDGQQERDEEETGRTDGNGSLGQTNYQVLDDDRVLERAESRKLNLSPVYPPGNPEVLYSDALLVYVKDFNQFVQEL